MGKTPFWFTFARAVLLLMMGSGLIIAGFLVDGLVSTRKRIDEIRATVISGMTVPELKKFLGTPSRECRSGGLPVPHSRSYTPPALSSGSAIYFYSQKGIPYFSVFVLIDEPADAVIRCDVDDSWW